MSYRVIKWVNGNPYLYDQISYRVGVNHDKVRTISTYLGRATAGDVLHAAPRHAPPPPIPPMAGDHKLTAQKPLPSAKPSPQQRYETQNPPVPLFEGLTDLTLTTLGLLEGKKQIARQFIADLARRNELKDAERQVLTDVLAGMTGKLLPVQDFADRCRLELLPLSTRHPFDPKDDNNTEPRYSRWHDYQLPEHFEPDDTYHYEETIYQLPFQTQGSLVHFGGNAPGYFAHVRHQDFDTGVRRIIELQSDLFQNRDLISDPARDTMTPRDAWQQVQGFKNSWYQRILREEIARAARDGFCELHLPQDVTVALIEQFISPKCPVEDAQPGDTVEVGWEEHLVLWSSSTGDDGYMTVRSDDITGRANWLDIVNEEITQIEEEIRGDLEFHLPDNDAPSDEQVHDLAEELFSRRFENDPDIYCTHHTSARGYNHYVVEDSTTNPTIIWMEEGAESSLQHPSEDLDPVDFDSHELPSGQLRVVNFYDRDLAKYARKIKPACRVERDDRYLPWLIIPIDPDADTRPPTAF